MGLKLEEIESLIKSAMPDAEITIEDLAGDDNHYSATIKSKVFAGKNKVEQHKLVYKALNFSLAVANVLKHLNVKFESINVLENEEIRQGIKTYSDWPTIPQLYIKGKFVGGSDIVKEMFEKGELKTLLEKESLI